MILGHDRWTDGLTDVGSTHYFLSFLFYLLGKLQNRNTFINSGPSKFERSVCRFLWMPEGCPTGKILTFVYDLDEELREFMYSKRGKKFVYLLSHDEDLYENAHLPDTCGYRWWSFGFYTVWYSSSET